MKDRLHKTQRFFSSLLTFVKTRRFSLLTSQFDLRSDFTNVSVWFTFWLYERLSLIYVQTLRTSQFDLRSDFTNVSVWFTFRLYERLSLIYVQTLRTSQFDLRSDFMTLDVPQRRKNQPRFTSCSSSRDIRDFQKRILLHFTSVYHLQIVVQKKDLYCMKDFNSTLT